MDDIHRIITIVHGIEGTVAGTFNRRFDLLFAEDCRNAEGRLNVRGGEEGMECVVAYLQSIHLESAGVPLDLAELKLTRVADELEHLWYVPFAVLVFYCY